MPDCPNTLVDRVAPRGLSARHHIGFGNFRRASVNKLNCCELDNCAVIAEPMLTGRVQDT